MPTVNPVSCLAYATGHDWWTRLWRRSGARVGRIEPVNAWPSFVCRVCCSFGRMLVWVHHPKAAAVLFRYAVRENPRNEVARYELASASWACGSQESATDQYRSLAAAHPQNLTIQYEFGFVLRNRECFQEAIDVLERALALEPRAEIHVELARCYRSTGRMDDANAALQRALRYSPDHPEALLEQVRTAAENRRWIDMLDSGLKLMSLQPTSEVAYYTGVGLAQCGRFAEAENVLREGLALESDSVDLVAELAVVLADQGKLLEATQHLDRALGRTPRRLQSQSCDQPRRFVCWRRTERHTPCP